jgi:ribose 5-phosphate isomerase A
MNFKQLAARQALSYVEDGMILGLGSGSTTKIFIEMLGEKVKDGSLQDLTGVPTSKETARQARSLGIPLVSLAGLSPESPSPTLDLAVDGADEVDPQLNLIKGLGHALLREKIVESHARRFVVIVDESKLVPKLGRGPLPVEISPYEAEIHVRWLQSLGYQAELWLGEDGSPILTDNGNYLARCWFSNGIPDPYNLARTLADRPGVVEHGLFLDMADLVVIAGAQGVQIKERS